MTTTGKIFTVSLFVGVGVGAYAYRRGIDDVVFGLDGFEIAPDGNLVVRLRVMNPTVFTYPVPRLIVNAFDDTGSFIGTIINNQFQFIPGQAISFVRGIVAPSWNNLASLISSIIINQSLPEGLVFHGEIQVGPVNIPFDTSAAIPVMGCGVIFTPEELLLAEEANRLNPVYEHPDGSISHSY